MSAVLLYLLIGFAAGSLLTILTYMLLLTLSGVEVTFPEDRRDA